MRRGCLAAAAFAFWMPLSSCSQSPMPAERTATLTAADEKAIRDAEAAWAGDWKSGDVDKILSHYTDDAFVTFPDWAFPAQGKDSIRTELKEFLAAGEISLDFTPSGRSQASPVRWGTYALSWTPEKGPYYTVFRKQADGSWRVAEQKYFGRHLLDPAPGGNYLRPPDPTAAHAIAG